MINLNIRNMVKLVHHAKLQKLLAIWFVRSISLQEDMQWCSEEVATLVRW